MVGGQTCFHAEVVVIFTVHDGGVDNAGTIGGGDPVSRKHRPCRGRIASWYGIGEERFVGATNEV